MLEKHGNSYRENNIWRSKILRLSFFHYPPEFQQTPSPWQIDPAPNGNDLGHYKKSYMKYILSRRQDVAVSFSSLPIKSPAAKSEED